MTDDTKPGECDADNLEQVEQTAVITITIHVLELVALAIIIAVYLLVKVWRRI